ncbi:DNA translocase FtsK [cf. Phormidesmis sp. LEGE 11477]|uniref:DNA translocase FtsK n=1 Tax=cf. Phormidesmis sp. LEGE 11477 TaxID=1828680 RepID=UPI0018822195|nr:DNA translocase FtsK [cf. Phormidesmis sp. LEGE 11477]MBE9062439.1 PD-(D/E)XK nuclease family protein [cf. Phormidesmis sp. LEGE 11477]
MSTPSSPPTSLSVTKVRLAFECPRLMYLGHHEGGMTMFRAANSNGGGVGLAFHKLCDDCVDCIGSDQAIAQLLTPPATQLDPETLSQQIQQHLYRAVFFPLVQKTVSETPQKVPALNQLWEGITGLIRRWAELLVRNRKFCEPKDVIRKTFLAQELSVKHTFDLPNGDRQLVRGRFDSLVYDFAQQRLCVVEYKTYQATDPAAQLAQVALYSYMLKQKLKVNINSAVYSVLPDWNGVEYPWDLLEDTLHKLIPHKLIQMKSWLAWQQPNPNPPPMTAHLELCNICPQKNKCQTYFETDAIAAPSEPQAPDLMPPDNIPPLVTGAVAESFALDYSKPIQVETLQVESLRVGTVQVESLPIEKPKAQQSRAKPLTATPSPVRSVSTGGAASEASDNVARQLVEVLQAFNVGVDYLGSALGPAFMHVKLMPHLGVRVNTILKFEDDIRVHLGLENPPLMSPQAGFISVDLPRPDRQTAFFRDYFAKGSEKNTAAAKVAIGVDLDGKLIEADLSDSNTCHFLVGGTTGSGKSEFLRSLLLSLIVRHDPTHFKVALVDPKRVTFPEFETMDWLYEPIVKTSEDAIALMERLVAEMEDRYQRFERSRCNDLSTYNQKQSQPIPRILCIFDEYADFMAEKETAKILEQSIKRLGAMARAAGIHLIIATQRPEAKVVTPLIRSNLPGRVALRTATAADSSIILGSKQEAAANLLGKGDLFYSGGRSLQRLQSLYAEGSTIAKSI